MSFFKYLEESTRQEREAIAAELKAEYNGILRDEQETFAELRRNENSAEIVQAYFEAVQRLGTIQAIFEILHIDYEPGKFYE